MIQFQLEHYRWILYALESHYIYAEIKRNVYSSSALCSENSNHCYSFFAPPATTKPMDFLLKSE